ncbi:MAG: GTPase HflX [Candidatus Omnitrophica bacterium]|nr:GTPase HflX [Candidatus Omnitrophota bacterium]MDD5310523.1 GTPase HflX [Candidatus Omnitrophota bacterium]MDD5546051.1 GTPase HflX [Candidatus Omnitrophota bacterium]
MEKALLVTVEFFDRKYKNTWKLDDVNFELRELVRSAGLQVVDLVECFKEAPMAGQYIGKGKAGEIGLICKDKGADVVIFGDDLSSTQQQNLEDIMNIKVIDRTQLILDIFAHRAHSIEGKVQVELAQLQYLLPRLKGKGIMLSRLGGGIGTRGPGEQKLEMDRRKIRERIVKLKDELGKIHARREGLRRKRHESDLSIVSLIGYTNAGKSTLLNALTDSDVIAQDRLFSTLDPTARRFILPNNQKVVFVDTVGFLHDLPHHLIEAFKATLEEVVEADVLIHVLDASSPIASELSQAVYEVMEELGIHDKPVVTVLNKVDKVPDKSLVERLRKDFENAIPVSALRKENLGELVQRISMILFASLIYVKAAIPQSEAKLLNQVYREASIIKREFKGDYVYLEADMPARLKNLLDKKGYCDKL